MWPSQGGTFYLGYNLWAEMLQSQVRQAQTCDRTAIPELFSHSEAFDAHRRLYSLSVQTPVHRLHLRTFLLFV